MMSSFVKQKPLFPMGATIGQFPPIIRPLHCDETCELYLLSENNSGAFLALFYRLFPEQNADNYIPKLKQWWALQSSNSLECEEISLISLAGQNHIQAILRVHGVWLPDSLSSLLDVTDSALRSLWQQTILLCEDAKKIGLCPTYSPSLVWLKNDVNNVVLIPLVVRTWSSELERESIKEISRLLYLLVTGIDPSENSDQSIVKLSKWAKNIMTNTSDLLIECLSSSTKNTSIEEFNALLTKINDTGIISKNHNNNSTISKSSTYKSLPANNTQQGLSKVAGMKKLKLQLQQEVIYPLREPEPFKRYGLTVPNGILLYGPPGCGKTYISKRLAEELGYFFIEVIPSEVAGTYIHQSVLKIRDIFETAAERAPSLIFIDEFEALVPPRSDLGAHQQYKAEEVNELLVQLGTCAEKNILLIAATNEPNKIDVAVRRTGRLDKLIYVGPPDEEARLDMLKMHMSNRPTAPNIDLAYLAQTLTGYSASDLKFFVDEAARMALLRDKSPITQEILLESIKKVPPSISPEDELRYQSFVERGAN